MFAAFPFETEVRQPHVFARIKGDAPANTVGAAALEGGTRGILADRVELEQLLPAAGRDRVVVFKLVVVVRPSVAGRVDRD